MLIDLISLRRFARCSGYGGFDTANEVRCGDGQPG